LQYIAASYQVTAIAALSASGLNRWRTSDIRCGAPSYAYRRAASGSASRKRRNCALVISVALIAKDRGIVTLCCGSAAASEAGCRPRSLDAEPIVTDTGPRIVIIVWPCDV
jgi:hypothetical protein